MVVFFVMGNLLDGVAFADPVPTIHAVSEGGNWSSADTWVEGRVPEEDDVVEINGTVRLNISTIVAGMVVTTGSVLEKSGTPTDYTLTVNGDVINNGTIQDYGNEHYYDLYMSVSGNITNNGIWRNYSLTMTGTIAINGTSAIDAANVKLTGNIEITGNPVLSGTVNFNNATLTVNSPNVVTFGGVTSTGTVNGTGRVQFTGNFSATLSGNISEIRFSGANQNISGSITVSSLTLGTGVKRISGNTTINGSLTVADGVTLEKYATPTDYTLTVNGDVINNGTIQDYGNEHYYDLYISVSGS